MFVAGVNGAKKEVRISTAADSDDYRWYDICEWEPQKGQQIYVAPGVFEKTKFAANPAFDALWIDQVEFVRVE